MRRNSFDDKSVVGQVMTLCRQVTSSTSAKFYPNLCPTYCHQIIES